MPRLSSQNPAKFYKENAPLACLLSRCIIQLHQYDHSMAINRLAAKANWDLNLSSGMTMSFEHSNGMQKGANAGKVLGFWFWFGGDSRSDESSHCVGKVEGRGLLAGISSPRTRVGRFTAGFRISKYPVLDIKYIFFNFF